MGGPSDQLVIAIHGNLSNKEDIPIVLFAEEAIKKGYQVLSFDLPEHGDRKTEDTLCKVAICVEELTKIMEYAKEKAEKIGMFANSIGAYFSLLAYKNEEIQQVWFLSPVVDMKQMIETMMNGFNITEEKLKEEQTVATPMGQNLYWDYYCYVLKHPITHWQVETNILYGAEDEICPRDTLNTFVETFSCNLTVVPEAKHYFHTPAELTAITDWLSSTM